MKTEQKTQLSKLDLLTIDYLKIRKKFAHLFKTPINKDYLKYEKYL